jgi:toxin-antitoxin system PIN domain toxin
VNAVAADLLVYAHREDSRWHVPARNCLRELAEGSAPWAIPLPCIHEFLLVVTQPRIWKCPTPLPLALAAVEAWRASPQLRLLNEEASFWPLFVSLVREANLRGRQLHDARIAALLLHHNVAVLWTTQRQFSHFPRLHVRNPL